MPRSLSVVVVLLAGALCAPGEAACIRAQVRADTTRLADTTRSLGAQRGDAFVRHVFAQQEVPQYAAAAAAYGRLLRRLDTARTAEEDAVLRPHLEALAVILPDTVRQETGLAGDEEETLPDLSALSPGVGARLLAWWRSQDPLPGTPENDRLEEHLERFAYAMQHYRTGGRFDDRGYTYLRLGPPYKKTSVDFDDARYRRRVLNQTVAVSGASFPDNELWIYPHVSRSAQYLFIERRRDRYQLGEPMDLVPSTMKNGLTPSGRGQRKGAALVRTMDVIYRQLALYHIDYSSRYTDAANYASQLDAQAFTGRPAGFGGQSPSVFAQSALMRDRTEEWHVARRRAKTVPRTSSNILRDAPVLPLAVRQARFLEPDGTTRTEVYWSARTEALAPPRRALKTFDKEPGEWPETYLLAATITQKGADYRLRTSSRKRHLVAAGDAGILLPQTYTVRGDTSCFHLAVQWDEYLLYDAEDPARMGPHLKSITYRADSLSALNPDDGALEMSDLKPLLAPSDTAAASEEPAPDLTEAPPFPFTRLTPKTPLALYFEVYHLARGPDGQTRYTVAYDVARRTKRAGLTGLLRGDETQRTSTESTRTGQRRATDEYILLDLRPWDRPGQLEITVRITDEVTGQTAERTVAFEMAPDAPSVPAW